MPVKLYVYQHLPDKTYVDTYPVDSYDKFLLVDVGNLNPEEFQNVFDTLHPQLMDAYPDKQIIFIADGMNISFYGVTEEDPNGSRLIDSELQHAVDVGETTQHTEE